MKGYNTRYFLQRWCYSLCTTEVHYQLAICRNSFLRFHKILLNIFCFFCLTNSEIWNSGQGASWIDFTWVTAVIETTRLGTELQDRLTLLPSASSTIRLPPGQIMWSTWLRTFSQIRSWVFKLNTSISVLECPMLHTMHPFFILSMWSRDTTFLFPVAVITMSTWIFC